MNKPTCVSCVNYVTDQTLTAGTGICQLEIPEYLAALNEWGQPQVFANGGCSHHNLFASYLKSIEPAGASNEGEPPISHM